MAEVKMLTAAAVVDRFATRKNRRMTSLLNRTMS